MKNSLEKFRFVLLLFVIATLLLAWFNIEYSPYFIAFTFLFLFGFLIVNKMINENLKQKIEEEEDDRRIKKNV